MTQLNNAEMQPARADPATVPVRNVAPRARTILLASFIGTSIEYFDFYVYATAAVIVFPALFFPPGDPATATLQSLATFALAFFARPLGAAIFGHLGDRLGRKITLVAALLTMGVATFVIGLLPSYEQIGVIAPALLALCRFAQGFGLGGEWGGAVLLASENAPSGKRAWYSMFPQLGAPIGLLGSTAVFWLLSSLAPRDFLAWGWRIPFVGSAALVLVGLYVRVRLTETVEYRDAMRRGQRQTRPLVIVLTRHLSALFSSVLVAMSSFVVLYLMTVFSLAWETSHLDIGRPALLMAQMIGVLFLGAAVVVSVQLAQRYGVMSVLLASNAGLIAFGFLFGPLLEVGTIHAVTLHCIVGLTLAGLSYGPLGVALTELFPTSVRYTGISLAFNLAGLLGASLTPYVATWIAAHGGVAWTGYYLSEIACISFIAGMATRARACAR